MKTCAFENTSHHHTIIFCCIFSQGVWSLSFTFSVICTNARVLSCVEKGRAPNNVMRLGLVGPPQTPGGIVGPWDLEDGICLYVCVSCSGMSDSLPPSSLTPEEPSRLICPRNSLGKNTRVGFHSLLQGIFPTQGLNPDLLHCRLILYHLRHQGNPGFVYCQRNKCLMIDFEHQPVDFLEIFSWEPRKLLSIVGRWFLCDYRFLFCSWSLCRVENRGYALSPSLPKGFRV